MSKDTRPIGDPEDPLRHCPAPLRERFAVTRVLGTGGMGAVFQGTMPGTGRPCALKVIFGNPGETAGVRLVQEAKLMSRVRHPNLIEVYDTGFHEGSPWVAMEMVEGDDLKEIAREKGGRLPAAEVEQVVRDVASVFTELHGQGILHRDIKPQNIMRTREGRTVVMDLGLARDVEATRHTATGALVGTLMYMAPEMLIRDEQAPPVDWYALGITAYVLLSGNKPYTADEVFAMTAQGEWKGPQPMPPQVRRTPIGRLTLGLVRPEPADRVTDEASALAVLEQVQSGAFPRANSSSMSVSVLPPVDMRAPMKRRRNLVALAVLGVCGLVLGFGAARFGGEGGGERPAGTDSAGRKSGGSPDADRDPWLDLCRRLGYPEAGDAGMAFESLIRDPDLGKADEAARLLEAEPQDSRTRYFILRYHEAKGTHDMLERLVRGLDYEAPIEDYWDARLMLEGIGYRLVYDGPYSKRSVESRQTKLRRDIDDFDMVLRGREELWAKVARMEYWNTLARRVQVRPALNIPAIEEANRQATELLHRVGEMEPFVAAAYLVAAGRGMARTGQFDRYRALYQLHETDAVRPLTEPELVAYWLHEMRFDGREKKIPGGVFSPQRIFKPSRDASWLPPIETMAGTGKLDAVQDPPILPDPDPPPRVELEAGDGGDAAAFREIADQAALEQRRLHVRREWIERHLPIPLLRKGGPLLDAVYPVPEVMLALEPVLEAREEHELLLELLRETDRRRRSSQGYLYERRLWYRAPWARFTKALVELEFRAGDLRRAMDVARTHMQHFAELPPPWHAAEVEAAWKLWRKVERHISKNGTCPGYSEEVRRVGLLLLEGLAAQRPEPGRGRVALSRWRRRMVETMLDWIWEHGVVSGGSYDQAVELLQELEGALEPLDQDLVGETRKNFVKLKAERVRRGLAGRDICPEGYAEELHVLPQVVFGDPAKDPVGRVRELIRKL